jgi:putative flippase GtrA
MFMPARHWSSRVSEPFRFGLVGIANTTTGLAVIIVGLAMGLGDVPANMLGYAVGLLQGFILNRRWTFRHPERLTGDVMGRYVAAFIVAYLINLFIVLALTGAGMVSAAAHITAAVIYTGVFFVLCRTFVFVPLADIHVLRRKIASLPANHGGLLLIAIAVALYVLLKDIPLGHDQSWYLISVQKILAGARPYVDLVELNPPLAFYLVMPPVYLAERFGSPPDHVFIAYVICLACTSTIWARYLLLKIPTIDIGQANIAAVVALLSTTALAVFDFGQRDVLLTIFTLPYLALSACRIEGVRVSRHAAVAVGLWAALGICLKHYFLVFPVVTEAVLYLNRRKTPDRLRPEIFAIGATCVAYAIVVVTLFPAYLETIVPMASVTYFAYGNHFPYSLMCTEILTLPLVFGAYLVMRQRGNLGARIDMLAAWTIAAFISYVIQNRGFTYHAEPLRIMLVLLTASLVVRKFDAPRSVLLPRIVLVIGLVLIAIRVSVLGLYDDQWATDVRERLNRYGTRDGIYTFTAHVFIGFPLANRIDGPWVSRFPCLWPIPGAQRILAAPENFTPAQVAAAERANRYVIDAVVEDFQRHLPSIVIVDTRVNKSYFDGVKFDYVANFQRDPRFARIWLNYKFAESVSGFEIWRKDPTGRAVAAP